MRRSYRRKHVGHRGTFSVGGGGGGMEAGLDWTCWNHR